MVLRRRLIFLITILALLISACSPLSWPDTTREKTSTPPVTKKTSPTPPTPQPSPTPTPKWLLPDAELKGVKIRFIHPWIGDLADSVQQMVDDFNRKNEYGITISVSTPGSTQQVFQVSEGTLFSDQAFNVVIAPIEELAYWYKMERLIPLDDFISDPQYGVEHAILDDMVETIWGQDLIDGQRLGIPISRNIDLLAINNTWANQLGFNQLPQSPSDFRQQMCAARDALLADEVVENNGMGGWIVKQEDYVILNWLNSFQLAEFPTSETAYAFNQPASLEGFTFIKELFNDDCAWNARNPDSSKYFANRQALAISVDVYDLYTLDKTFTLLESSDRWSVMPYPHQEDQAQLFFHGESIGILRSGKAVELASWIFLNWFIQTKQQEQLFQLHPALPVRCSIAEQIRADRPRQWKQAYDLLEYASPAPRSSEWRVARFLLQDATYQVFMAHITPESFPAILEMLDQMIAELKDAPASLSWE
jgi:ABC-type glycerol-3-phosphate transport system substrate-binding protein